MGCSPVPRVVALIPAHNEQELLPHATGSIEAQTIPVAQIYVVSDNSTDRTQEIARTWGGKVGLFETVGNRDKKSGALNQAFDALLEAEDSDTWVLVVDADSRIVPQFIERALHAIEMDQEIGAVGGIFLTEDDASLLMRLQSNEYTRYAREIARDHAKARVLTGTATISRVGILREVRAQRAAGFLPGLGVYNRSALTEDFDLTLAFKRLGYKTTSPKGCIVYTEAMPTLSRLWRQRTRWQWGALECLRNYGLNRITLPYVIKQGQMGFGILALALLLTVTAWSWHAGTLEFQPLWFGSGVVFFIERMVSVWRAGRRSIRLAAMVVPEMGYDLLIASVYMWVVLLMLFHIRATWGIATIDQKAEKEAECTRMDRTFSSRR